MVNSEARSLIETDQDEDEVNMIVNLDEKIYSYLKDSSIKKVIYIKNKLINYVV